MLILNWKMQESYISQSAETTKRDQTIIDRNVGDKKCGQITDQTENCSDKSKNLYGKTLKSSDEWGKPQQQQNIACMGQNKNIIQIKPEQFWWKPTGQTQNFSDTIVE